jgi:phage terminase large subunit
MSTQALPVVDLSQLNTDEFYDPWPKQKALHTSKCIDLLAIGGNGSGKSAFLLGEAIFICLEFPGADCLLLRKNFPELEKGLILDLKNTLPAGLYKYNDQKHVVTFPNGSHIFFGHCKSGSEKDLAKYLSSAFVWIGIDELGQFSYDAFAFMASRNRINKGCRPNKNGEWPVPRMGGASNPMGPGWGWMKKVWIEKKPVSQMGTNLLEWNGAWYSIVTDKAMLALEEIQKRVTVINGESYMCVYDPADYFFVHSTVVDNPSQLEKDPDYINKLMKLAPALRAKALYGDLKSISGSYFQNFTQDRHVLSLPRDNDLIEWQSWQPRWIGIDWGLAHWCAVYWATKARVRKFEGAPWRQVTVIYRELVENEKGYDEISTLIGTATPKEERAQLKHVYLSPERFARQGEKDPSRTIGIQMGLHLRQQGLPMCEKANDRRVDGAVYMYNGFENDEIIILDNCPGLIAAIEVVVRNESNPEDVLKVEGAIEDDCYDGGRYTVYSEAKPRPKDAEVEYHEHLAKIPDPMAQRMYSLQHHLKKKDRFKTIKPRFKL